MKPDRTQFKVAFATKLLDAIKEIAEREHRSVSGQIHLMLERQLEAENATT